MFGAIKSSAGTAIKTLLHRRGRPPVSRTFRRSKCYSDQIQSKASVAKLLAKQKKAATVKSAPSLEKSKTRQPHEIANSPSDNPEKPFVLPEPSDEHKYTAETFLNTKKNIIANCCPGWGKTTAALRCAHARPDQRFLLLVYNRRLMDEVKDKAAALGITNLDVFTYHALGYQLYTSECRTDRGLKRVVLENMPPKTLPPLYDVAILDEQQDMTKTMYRFVGKFLRDMHDAAVHAGIRKQTDGIVRLIILGDPYQEIYGFNGADSRFLTMADKPDVFGTLGGGSGKKMWEKINNRTVYRSTPQIVKFINEQLGMFKGAPGDKLKASPTTENDDNPRPRYIQNDAYDPYTISKEVTSMIEKYRLRPEEILIAAPSIRFSKISPVHECVNELALRGFPFYVPVDHEDLVDSEKAKRGKIQVLTFHQSKGIDRQAVVLFYWDDSYHQYFNKAQEDKHKASNAQFVAATRAKKHLILAHDYRHGDLPCIDRSTLADSCEVVENKPLEVQEDETDREPESENVARFWVGTVLKKASERTIADCFAEIELNPVTSPSTPIQVPGTVPLPDDLFESVIDINMFAFHALTEFYSRKTFTNVLTCIRKYDHPLFARLPTEHTIKFLKIIQQLRDDPALSLPDLLYLSNFTNALETGFLYKILSIPLDEYTWLEPVHSMQIRKNITIKSHPLRRPRYRSSVSRFFQLPSSDDGAPPIEVILQCGNHMYSRTDGSVQIYVTGLWRAEHFIHALLCHACVQNDTGVSGDCIVVNPLTGQAIRVTARREDSVDRIVRLLVDAAMEGERDEMTDSQFLEAAARGFVGEGDAVVALPPWVNGD